MGRQPAPRQNQILAAIESWLKSLGDEPDVGASPDKAKLLETAPKRFTAYEPMVLLPTGSFTAPCWIALLDSIGEEARSRLWNAILAGVSKRGQPALTHLATNEGIPLSDGVNGGAENVLRSPCRLKMLQGDFGPASVTEDARWEDEFNKAFWVSTKQNGVIQTWAPRWTMFSRGNVKEKARLMTFPAVTDRTSQHWAVDLYAGIGYFVFSYAKLGFRVLCWEINPWSIEGLRRGAVANGWTVKVVQGEELARPLEHWLAGDEQIVVLSESNERAMQRLQALPRGIAAEHVNCGFLPTSRPVWEDAWMMTAGAGEAWLHLHDNVGTKDVEARKSDIQDLCEAWSKEQGIANRLGKVEHVEYVKTYAPDVWHCVFDVHITSPPSLTG